MASIRISAALRDHVVAGLLRHRFNVEELELREERDRIQKLREERSKHGYELAFTPAERKRLAEAPEGWFPTLSSVRVQVEGGVVEDVQFEKAERVPYEVKDNRWSKVAAVVTGDELYFKLDKQIDEAEEALSQRDSALREKKNELRNRAVAVIESVTTVNRLLEIWPEVHDFLPEENAGPGGGVPAILVSDLNDQFGLKKAA